MSDSTATFQGSLLSQHTQLLVKIVIAAVTQDYDTLKGLLQTSLERGVAPVVLYEALLQTYLFAGFPAALESLTMLSLVLQQFRGDVVSDQKPVREEYNVADFRIRGEDLCKRVYTSAYHKMTELLEQHSPELREWMIIEGYGKTLSREGLNVLVRELLNVAVLAVLGWERQLYSHLRGSLNVGATITDCQGVLDLLPTSTDQQQQRKHKAMQMLQQITVTFINKQL